MRQNQSALAQCWIALSLLLGGLGQGVLANEKSPSIIDPDWDITLARGKTQTISFTTDRGTWMSVDIAPDGQWLVFDLLGHIYRIPAKGGAAENLTESSGIALNYHPRISPDGREIAFISDRKGQDNLWIMQADGSGVRPIILDADSRFVEPAWMPDGSRIVVNRRLLKPNLGFRRTDDTIWSYARSGGDGQQIVGIGERTADGMAADNGWYRQDLWGGQPRRQWPTVTPDGRTVYFHSSNFDGTSRHLRRVDIATGHVQDVTEGKDNYRACCARPPHPLMLGEIAPEVSPNGRWLTFARRIVEGRFEYRGHEHVGRTALWLRDLETGKEKILMDPITYDAMDNLPNWHDRVLPGYSWAKDSESIVLSHDGRLKRVWIASGKIETIPFTAEVKRTISEMAQSQTDISGDEFTSRQIRWPSSSPDGKRLVFESAGQLWLTTLTRPKPQPLLTLGNEEVHLTPSWSADGQWIAFATSDDALGGKGHLWKIHAGSGQVMQLTEQPAAYLYPFWNAEGSWVYASRWPPEVNRAVGAEDLWELVRVPATAGAIEMIAKTGARVDGGFGADGAIHFSSPHLPGSRALVSLQPDGSGRKVQASIAGSPQTILPSPDQQWLAIAQYQDVYLLPNPAATSDKPIDILADDALELRRLSLEGGRFPHWLDNDTLEYATAGTSVRYSLSSGKTRQFAVAPTLKRDQASGTIALTGARIITLGDAGVIEQGTVLVDGARITCVGQCNSAGADRVIALDGKTIIPGWVDTHAHYTGTDADGIVPRQRARSALYLAYGVTTTFDPSGNADTSFTLAEMTETGRILGPRTFSTELALLCGDLLGGLRSIGTLADAEEHVNRKARLGVISVKDYKQCTRSQRQMVAEASRRAGLALTTENGPLTYILGHIMNGGTGWEHPLQYAPVYGDVTTFLGQAGAHYSGDLLFTGYPHSVIMEYWMGNTDLWTDPRIKLWQPWQVTAARRTFVKKPLEEYLSPIFAEAAADLMEAGGYVTTGAHGEQDGLGNHWEAWTLGLALTPLQVLTAASLHGAHFIGLDHAIGSLEAGKYADLVVLNQNPLDDIRSTTDNLYVMKAGKLYRTDTLDQLWPDERAYGSRPWLQDETFRADLRKLEN